MPKGKPTKPIPCAYCGELFLPANNRDRLCSDPCRILGNTDKNGPVPQHKPELGPCWIWTAGKYPKGYGAIRHSKTRWAHRASYLTFVGEIPDGLCVLHKCDNPTCVNPEHLFLGTEEDNNKDRDEKERQAKGERHPRAKLTRRDTFWIRFLYSTGKVYQKRLARTFGVHDSTISGVVTGKYWKSA